MSRRNRLFAALAALTCLAGPWLGGFDAPALAGVVVVENDAYSLDGGRPVVGAWEVAEKIAVAHDTAVVVLGSNVKPATIQTMIQLLESLHVPTLLTKKADYKALLERGVVKPSRTPAAP